MKLYSAYYDERDPFGIFEKTVPFSNWNVLDKNDGVLVLWGGEDISPSIYGQAPVRQCHAGTKPSFRDRFEIMCAKRAQELGMPIIGVCRGAQLMCALNGGTLVQHVEGHAHGQHKIVTDEGEIFSTNSIHHQMMNLEDTDHKLLAWVPENLSTVYIGEHQEKLRIEKEPEIVFFPKTKTLAIQGHPEYLQPSNPFVQHCTRLIDRYLTNV